MCAIFEMKKYTIVNNKALHNVATIVIGILTGIWIFRTTFYSPGIQGAHLQLHLGR